MRTVAPPVWAALLATWLLLLTPASALPQALTQVASLPGPVSRIAADARLLVAGGGTGVRVVDISQPDAPTVVGDHDFADTVLGLALDGDSAYVANSHEGLHRLAVSPSAAPRLTGSAPTRGQAAGVALSGTHVFVADNSLGFDIVEPEGVTRIGEYLGDGFPRGIATMGSLVLVADAPAGLVVVDVTAPDTPTVIGHLSLGNDPITGVVVPRAAAGDPAPRVASVTSRVAGLQLVDISDPTAPAFAANVDTASPPRGVAMDGPLLYVVSQGRLETFNLTDPTQPALVATQTVSDGASAVAVNDSLVFVGSTDGLSIFQQPSSPW